MVPAELAVFCWAPFRRQLQSHCHPVQGCDKQLTHVWVAAAYQLGSNPELLKEWIPELPNYQAEGTRDCKHICCSCKASHEGQLKRM